jgi:DNA-binding PadR family transcriptional regulator
MTRDELLQYIIAQLPTEIEPDEFTIKEAVELSTKQGKKVSEKTMGICLNALVEEGKLTKRQAKKRGRLCLAYKGVVSDGHHSASKS